MNLPSASVVNDVSLYRFDPIERPIKLVVTAAFIRRLTALTSGWAISPWTGAKLTPCITVTHDGNAYAIASDWLDQPLRYTDDADATCMFFLEMLTAYADSHPDLFFLHAGAADIGGQLAVFPAIGKAGKSTLVATLAAAGAAIFCDDALPVFLDRGSGSALGIAPRPRLPWPSSLDRVTRDFLDRHIGLSNANFAYVALPPGIERGGLASLGTERPIGAFVLPDRNTDEQTTQAIELLPASRAETMARLIGQHLGKSPPAHAMVQKLATLVGRTPCWRLCYRDASEAARYLVAQPPFQQNNL